MSGYKGALEAAGAKVFAFHEFGSYQGEWVALVVYNNESGWVTGSYGSCSGCDAFEGEFGCDSEDTPGYKERLAEFGRSYLDGLIITTEQVLEPFRKQASWDSEAERAIATIEATGGDFMCQVVLALAQGESNEQ